MSEQTNKKVSITEIAASAQREIEDLEASGAIVLPSARRDILARHALRWAQVAPPVQRPHQPPILDTESFFKNDNT